MISDVFSEFSIFLEYLCLTWTGVGKFVCDLFGSQPSAAIVACRIRSVNEPTIPNRAVAKSLVDEFDEL